MTVRIGDDGRVTIPAKVFAAAGLKAGDGLRARKAGDRRVIVERVLHPMKEVEMAGAKRRYRVVAKGIIYPMEDIEIVGVKRRVTIPATVLEAAGLRQGDNLEVSTDPKTPGAITFHHPDS